MKCLKIILLAFFLLFFCFKEVRAYIPESPGELNNVSVIEKFENETAGTNEYNPPSYVLESLKNLELSAIIHIYGFTQEKYQQGLGKGGAIAGVSNLISQMYTYPPVSSKEYFADLGKNLGIIKPIYAQTGVGFTGLRNLLPLWKATRNLSYVFFILVFLYMGVAIMLRVKLDPKTVIGLQDAIPKLVIALILVTFSYAIAGLLVDLIYLIIYLGVLALKDPVEKAGSSVGFFQTKLATINFGGSIATLFGIIRETLPNLISGQAAGLGGILGYALTALALSFVTHPAGFFGILLTAVLPLLIIGVVILFLIFKLFISLLGCYVSIIISVITAPLQIMIGSLPGTHGGFGTWFKNLTVNILVFPAVALAILISWLLTTSYGPTWSPPVLGTSGESLAPILGLGLLLVIHKIPETVKAAFKMKPGILETAINEPVGMAYKTVQVAAEKIGEKKRTEKEIEKKIEVEKGVRAAFPDQRRNQP
ncbi:hypothetical protein COT64_02470 [Candidatus Shapirobacteria bacterium CG09_land_8_20_14_0_10_39_12]|uniref:Uncharacterized protein n=1 Tax=Candidatus Shapirobacteria bacterium CG09_land_8_20_14_0_10_39_12 TaxID=1974885 RepID=A0A2H0WPB3_9BACT|nr:MAG: hypothetical protein COT64_02470 [Candidatus Shapirobacteria bacterium CG09_land_8_20_14_0_10_39_12]